MANIRHFFSYFNHPIKVAALRMKAAAVVVTVVVAAQVTAMVLAAVVAA